MNITICDICGKSLKTNMSTYLPVKDTYHITNCGEILSTFEKNLHLEKCDVCVDCLNTIYDFIKALKENSNDT